MDTRDAEHDLLWFTERCLDNVRRLGTMLEEAEADDDTELAEFFRRAQEHSRTGAEMGRQLLRRRWGAEG